MEIHEEYWFGEHEPVFCLQTGYTGLSVYTAAFILAALAVQRGILCERMVFSHVRDRTNICFRFVVVYTIVDAERESILHTKRAITALPLSTDETQTHTDK